MNVIASVRKQPPSTWSADDIAESSRYGTTFANWLSSSQIKQEKPSTG
jgi:hypothetical protein